MWVGKGKEWLEARVWIGTLFFFPVIGGCRVWRKREFNSCKNAPKVSQSSLSWSICVVWLGQKSREIWNRSLGPDRDRSHHQAERRPARTVRASEYTFEFVCRVYLDSQDRAQ